MFSSQTKKYSECLQIVVFRLQTDCRLVSSVSTSEPSGTRRSSSHGWSGGVSPGSHHGGARSSNTTGGTRQSRLGRAGSSHTSASSSANSWPSAAHGNTGHSFVIGWGTLHSHR